MNPAQISHRLQNVQRLLMHHHTGKDIPQNKKKYGSAKTSIFRRDFWQLCYLIANISGTHEISSIGRWHCKLHFPYKIIIWWTLVHKRRKIFRSTQRGHHAGTLWNTTENVLCAAACSPSWRTLSNTNSINGRRVDRVNAVGSCQSYCVALPSCVAVDFNYDERSCWAHVDAADLDPDNVYQQPGTDQLRINRTCPDQVTTVSTGLAACVSSAGFIQCQWRDREVHGTGVQVHPVAYFGGMVRCLPP